MKMFFQDMGVLREIVTNQGAQFSSKLVEGKNHIRHKQSTTYHPQENG